MIHNSSIFRLCKYGPVTLRPGKDGLVSVVVNKKTWARFDLHGRLVEFRTRDAGGHLRTAHAAEQYENDFTRIKDHKELWEAFDRLLAEEQLKESRRRMNERRERKARAAAPAAPEPGL